MSRQPRNDLLTPEQLHLAGLLADTALTHEELAADLGVTLRAVKGQVSAVYEKLGLTGGGREALRRLMLECELAAAE